jgi:cell division protein ZapA (FtsZ GTPase activity inhibitor)
MSIVCTQSEKEKIKELAKEADKKISTFCIEKILG